ncbi:MAG: argininosuccinate synthase [Flavobacteriaceae bacterium]|nr:argininosuccinate synthase [Flavobacteriaceae bacterium]
MNKKKLVLAYSGGLDTSYCMVYFAQELQMEVHAVTVNTGGFNKEEIKEIEAKALQMGAASYQCISALDTFYDTVVRFLIYGNVLKNNTYPLSVSAERIVQAMEIVKAAKAIGANALAHGSTGAGNDQVRFDLIFQTMAPDMEILTPIRDKQLSRREEIEYLKEYGVDKAWEKAKYSINQGLWGTSVGGAETLTSHAALPEEAYPSALNKNGTEQLSLQFKKGELVAVNGQEDIPVNCIRKLQNIAKEYAIGRDIHVGDTIIGIKGRVGFEAAAPMIIIKAHHALEKHVLTKWQLHHKEQLGSFYGMLLHEGQYLDAVMRDFEAFLESTQSKVDGEVYVQLHPYRFEILGIQSDNDLMDVDFGAYGEMNNAWTANDAKGFIKITANAGKIYEHKNQEK